MGFFSGWGEGSGGEVGGSFIQLILASAFLSFLFLFFISFFFRRLLSCSRLPFNFYVFISPSLSSPSPSFHIIYQNENFFHFQFASKSTHVCINFDFWHNFYCFHCRFTAIYDISRNSPWLSYLIFIILSHIIFTAFGNNIQTIQFSVKHTCLSASNLF